jgi:hypothetical protein
VLVRMLVNTLTGQMLVVRCHWVHLSSAAEVGFAVYVVGAFGCQGMHSSLRRQLDCTMRPGLQQSILQVGRACGVLCYSNDVFVHMYNAVCVGLVDCVGWFGYGSRCGLVLPFVGHSLHTTSITVSHTLSV